MKSAIVTLASIVNSTAHSQNPPFLRFVVVIVRRVPWLVQLEFYPTRKLESGQRHSR